MGIQAALGSDIALAFDECTPAHADRDYTARSTERTHRWLDRCLEWHEREGPADQAVFGIVQGGVHEDLRRESAERIGGGGGRRDRDRRHPGPRQGGDARRARLHAAAAPAARRPATCSGSARWTTCWPGSRWGSTCSTARSRPGSRGTASRWPPSPRAASGSTWPRPLRRGRLADRRGLRLRGLHPPHRAYLHYLARAKELTGARLLTLHNLTYMRTLVSGAREAIEAADFQAFSGAVLGGAPPWDAARELRH